jgi:hypothetical protein
MIAAYLLAADEKTRTARVTSDCPYLIRGREKGQSPSVWEKENNRDRFSMKAGVNFI